MKRGKFRKFVKSKVNDLTRVTITHTGCELSSRLFHLSNSSVDSLFCCWRWCLLSFGKVSDGLNGRPAIYTDDISTFPHITWPIVERATYIYSERSDWWIIKKRSCVNNDTFPFHKTFLYTSGWRVMILCGDDCDDTKTYVCVQGTGSKLKGCTRLRDI